MQTTFDSLAQGVSRTYWYIWTPTPYALLGMQLTNDSGAVAGLRVVDQWLVGATTTGCTDDGAVTSCPIDASGVPSMVAWADDRSGTLTPPTGLTQVCTHGERLHAGDRVPDDRRDAGAADSLDRRVPAGDQVDGPAQASPRSSARPSRTGS